MPAPLRFRAWHTEQKRIFSPEEMGADELTLAVDGRGLVNVNSVSPRLSQYAGDRMIVMQFTGFTDVNGMEIFEGDIVQDGQGNRYPVVFERGAFRTNGIVPVPTDENGSPLFRDKVIGNIHQNPELLSRP